MIIVKKTLIAVVRWVSTQAGNSNGRVYAVDKSPTAKPLPDEKFNINFPHASASGIVVEDTLALSSRSVVLKDFALGVVDQSSGISEPTFDGFIGLGFRGSSPDSKAPTHFEFRIKLPSFFTFFSSLHVPEFRPSKLINFRGNPRFNPNILRISYAQSSVAHICSGLLN